MKARAVTKGEIAVFVVPEKEYASRLKSVISSASSSCSRICYVSLNKPYSSAAETVEKSGADPKKFFFIDCTESHAEETGQVVNVSSPKALTEMSITIGKVLDLGKIEALIFDSLSTLLIYTDPSTVVKFTHSLISALRSKKVAGALICLEGGKNAELIKDISMFSDRVVR
jgi:hypothetical protein